jgi:hypothetical protein
MLAFLGLFDGDGCRFANFNAAFAAQALVCIHGNGFSILKFEHFNRTNINTFSAALTFSFVHNRVKCH